MSWTSSQMYYWENLVDLTTVRKDREPEGPVHGANKRLAVNGPT